MIYDLAKCFCEQNIYIIKLVPLNPMVERKLYLIYKYIK